MAKRAGGDKNGKKKNKNYEKAEWWREDKNKTIYSGY